MISANGGLSAHRYTPQVTERWPRGSEPASLANNLKQIGMCVYVNMYSYILGLGLVAHEQNKFPLKM